MGDRGEWCFDQLTADLQALVEAVLAVVLAVTQPLLGDALVLGAGELVPQAGRVYAEQKGGNGLKPRRTSTVDCATVNARSTPRDTGFSVSVLGFPANNCAGIIGFVL